MIIGAGVVGTTLAKYLAGHQNSVTVIELDPTVATAANNRLDVSVVTGSGALPSVLKSAGLKKADMLIAVTPDDGTNLLACAIAKQFGVRKRIARIRSDEYIGIPSELDLEELGVSIVVQPENEVVERIRQIVELPDVTQTANLQDESVYMRGYILREGMPLCGIKLSDFNQHPHYSPVFIVTVIRQGRALIPSGDLSLCAGDEIIPVMPETAFGNFKRLLNVVEHNLGKVIVYGDSVIATKLAVALRSDVKRVVLVDPDEVHAREVASQYDGIEVLHGDCTNSEVLQEIKAGSSDYFIAATKDGEDNIVSALMAKAEGARHVAAIRDDSRYASLFETMGLNHIINPRKITSAKILESIHLLPMGSLIKLKNLDLEITHFQANGSSKIIGKPLKDFRLLDSKEIIVACILRGDQLILPDGETVINDEDRVMVLCPKKSVATAKKLFI